MIHLLACLALFSLAAVALGATPLVSPVELDALRARPGVRIVDIRPADAYAAGHVPGAVSAPYGAWRGPASNPGELPSLARLTSLVQGLGMSPSTHVVVVSSGADSTDFGASARIYWTLKVLGLTELSILNGGFDAWSEAKLPQETAATTVEPSRFAPTIDARLIATRGDVETAIERGGVKLVDARPAEYFQGDTRHPAAKQAGTLKGAVSLPYSRWFDGDGATFATAGAASVAPPGAVAPRAGSEAETISFCNTGHWAAINWFALSEVEGRKNVRLYPGSMVDWTQDAKPLPMDHVPNRAKQLWIDAKLWAARTFE
jgi:thiosulfate/3-mercaptopyruvate sulfurtransferase